MTIRGALPLVNAMVDRLAAELPAALAAQVAVNGGDVPLPAPKRTLRYVPQDEGEYPLLMVLSGPAAATVQTGGWLTTERELILALELRADSEEHLAIGLLMYEAALMEAALKAAPPEPFLALDYDRTEPAPIFVLNDPQTTVWQSWIEVHFIARQYEEDRTP